MDAHLVLQVTAANLQTAAQLHNQQQQQQQPKRLQASSKALQHLAAYPHSNKPPVSVSSSLTNRQL
jgi:hypothetical protein